MQRVAVEVTRVREGAPTSNVDRARAGRRCVRQGPFRPLHTRLASAFDPLRTLRWCRYNHVGGLLVHRLRYIMARLFIVSALLWFIAVLPLFLLGIGMWGETVRVGVALTIQDALSGNAISLVMIVGTVALIGLPWALWALARER